MNIIDPPEGAIWGKFNNRPLNQAWVHSLSESFTSDKDSCTDGYSLDVALDPAWLQDSTVFLPTVEGLAIGDVPVMRFNTEGKLQIKDNNLWMLGGNHRRQALRLYVDNMKEELLKTKQAIDKAISGKTDVEVRGMNSDQLTTVREGQERMKILQDKIDNSGMWTVRVYDRGASYLRPHARPPWPTRPPYSQDHQRPRFGEGEGDLPLHFSE